MKDEVKKDSEIYKIPKSGSPYKPTVGSLGVATIPGGATTWYTCRDTFHGVTNATKYAFILFCHQKDRQPNIIKFIRMIESVAGVKEENCVSFQATDDDNILRVNLSDWWNYHVRRSLLTAFLRCGQHFEKDNGPGFTKALKSTPYTSSTMTAISRFLSGATACTKVPKNGFYGWQAFFSGKKESDVKNLLVKLKKVKPVPEGQQPVPEGQQPEIKPEVLGKVTAN